MLTDFKIDVSVMTWCLVKDIIPITIIRNDNQFITFQNMSRISGMPLRSNRHVKLKGAL